MMMDIWYDSCVGWLIWVMIHSRLLDGWIIWTRYFYVGYMIYDSFNPYFVLMVSYDALILLMCDYFCERDDALSLIASRIWCCDSLFVLHVYYDVYMYHVVFSGDCRIAGTKHRPHLVSQVWVCPIPMASCQRWHVFPSHTIGLVVHLVSYVMV